MFQCNMGYTISENGTPPDRCNSENKYYITHCKECNNYNKNFDLINQAIESAKCRIYRLKLNSGNSYAHQEKSKNQQELMKITIDALEYYKNNC